MASGLDDPRTAGKKKHVIRATQRESTLKNRAERVRGFQPRRAANSTKKPATRTLPTRAFVSRGKTKSSEHRHKPTSRSHAARKWTMDGDMQQPHSSPLSRPSLLRWAPQLLWSARKLVAVKREPHCAEEGAELGFRLYIVVPSKNR